MRAFTLVLVALTLLGCQGSPAVLTGHEWLVKAVEQGKQDNLALHSAIAADMHMAQLERQIDVLQRELVNGADVAAELRQFKLGLKALEDKRIYLQGRANEQQVNLNLAIQLATKLLRYYQAGVSADERARLAQDVGTIVGQIKRKQATPTEETTDGNP